MKTAAAYIRVSTEDQVEYSPDSQLKAIRDYARKNDMILPEEFIFVDEGISGRKAAKRPEFMKMIGTAKIKPKQFDVILLWKFSRFARNREDSIVYKSMLRKQCGIEVISISEQLGEDKTSILIEALIEAMDEYYSINLAEEVRRGMTEKAQRGEVVSTPPFGYDVKDNVFVPNPETAPIVKMIFNKYLSGRGCLEIAKELNTMGIRTKYGNKWENRGVEYVLRNVVYTGKLTWTPVKSKTRDYKNEATIITQSFDHKESGNAYYLRDKNSGKYLTVSNTYTLSMSNFSSSLSQEWKFNKSGSYYKITSNEYPSYYLSINSNSTGSYKSIELSKSNTAFDQTYWIFNVNSNDSYRVQSLYNDTRYSSNVFLANINGQIKAKASSYPDNSIEWVLEEKNEISEKEISIINMKTGRYIDYGNGNVSLTSQFIDNDRLKWRLIYTGNDEYIIKVYANPFEMKCNNYNEKIFVDIPNGSVHWKFKQLQDGSYTILNSADTSKGFSPSDKSQTYVRYGAVPSTYNQITELQKWFILPA